MGNKNLLLSTRNQNKRKELEEILTGLEIEILTLDQAGEYPIIEEDGHTFAENAIKKAGIIAKLSGYITLADDSGLMVDALNGAPGIYSARFAGDNAGDEQNNRKLLKLLKDVAEPDRTARFICTIAVCSPAGQVATAEGRCEGKIGFEPRGQGGFGYDPLFIPCGYDKTFAEMDAAQKNRISHRARALNQARNIIEKFFTR